MGFLERLRLARAGLVSKASSAAKKPGSKPGPADEESRKPGQDWLSKSVRVFVAALTEVLKLGREMLVIPAQIWLLVAEIAGAAILRVWRLALAPALRGAWKLIRYLFAAAERHVTPARAVAAVALAAAVGLAASQWLDYRSVTVGNDAYSGGVEAVAPAPDVARDRAGEAHAWVMVPLALAAMACVAVAVARRPRAGRLLIAIGIAAIAISVVVDAPKGLDEGAASVAYEGAEARLLEGFWAQIATGGVLAVCGLILPGQLRPAPAGATAPGRPTVRSVVGRARGRLRLPRPKAGAPKPSAPKPSPPKGSSA